MKKVFIALLLLLTVLLSCLFLVEKKQISQEKKDVDIAIYRSQEDKDGDGVDDQTDILQNAKAYLATKPKYKSIYYDGGYPDDNFGVCTDVVAFAMRDAGYDLKELVDADIRKNRDRYQVDAVDSNIDFRRVRNLKVYFKNNHISLTTVLEKPEDWQAGDIVIFKEHIGVLSDKRSASGYPYVLHLAPGLNYEAKLLENHEIYGHYRVS